MRLWWSRMKYSILGREELRWSQARVESVMQKRGFSCVLLGSPVTAVNHPNSKLGREHGLDQASAGHGLLMDNRMDVLQKKWLFTCPCNRYKHEGRCRKAFSLFEWRCGSPGALSGEIKFASKSGTGCMTYR